MRTKRTQAETTLHIHGDDLYLAVLLVANLSPDAYQADSVKSLILRFRHWRDEGGTKITVSK